MADDMRRVDSKRIHQGQHIIRHIGEAAAAINDRVRVGFAKATLVQGDAAKTGRQREHRFFPECR